MKYLPSGSGPECPSFSSLHHAQETECALYLTPYAVSLEQLVFRSRVASTLPRTMTHVVLRNNLDE